VRLEVEWVAHNTNSTAGYAVQTRLQHTHMEVCRGLTRDQAEKIARRHNETVTAEEKAK